MGNPCCSLCLKCSFVTFYETLDPGEWTPPWSTRVLKEGAIEVTIGHSPPRFNLTQFNVYLLRRSLYENSAFKTISYTQPVSFSFTMLKRRTIRFTHSLIFPRYKTNKKDSFLSFKNRKKILAREMYSMRTCFYTNIT